MASVTDIIDRFTSLRDPAATENDVGIPAKNRVYKVGIIQDFKPEPHTRHVRLEFMADEELLILELAFPRTLAGITSYRAVCQHLEELYNSGTRTDLMCSQTRLNYLLGKRELVLQMLYSEERGTLIMRPEKGGMLQDLSYILERV